MTEKKRLTLTGNKMPGNVYKKLEELGQSRKLTPYIVSLVEKEEKTDELIKNLSTFIEKMEHIEDDISIIKKRINQNDLPTKEQLDSPIDNDSVEQGELNVSDNITEVLKNR